MLGGNTTVPQGFVFGPSRRRHFPRLRSSVFIINRHPDGQVLAPERPRQPPTRSATASAESVAASEQIRPLCLRWPEGLDRERRCCDPPGTVLERSAIRFRKLPTRACISSGSERAVIGSKSDLWPFLHGFSVISADPSWRAPEPTQVRRRIIQTWPIGPIGGPFQCRQAPPFVSDQCCKQGGPPPPKKLWRSFCPRRLVKICCLGTNRVHPASKDKRRPRSHAAKGHRAPQVPFR